jgi:hypothetical protein
MAVLNDVNETIREQYAHQPLSQSHIPRQIVAKVDGALPDFSVNLDENGVLGQPLRHAQSAWLRARATAERGDHTNKDDYQKQKEGLSELLDGLVPLRILGRLL